MGLPLMHLSRITTWKLSLTRLSSCHISQQPPSSAKSSFLLACKSVPILPCDPFSFRPLLCLTYTVFVASLCSLSPLFAPLLSLSSIPSTHSWCYCQSDFSKKKKKKNYHFFTDIPSMASITCFVNFVILSISYKVLYGLASPHPSGVMTATPPFTLGYTSLQLTHPPVLKYLWFTKAPCSSVPQGGNSSVVPLHILVPLLRILSIQMAPQPAKFQVLLQHSGYAVFHLENHCRHLLAKLETDFLCSLVSLYASVIALTTLYSSHE